MVLMPHLRVGASLYVISKRAWRELESFPEVFLPLFIGEHLNMEVQTSEHAPIHLPKGQARSFQRDFGKMSGSPGYPTMMVVGCTVNLGQGRSPIEYCPSLRQLNLGVPMGSRLRPWV
jgi:hypothetical protein